MNELKEQRLKLAKDCVSAINQLEAAVEKYESVNLELTKSVANKAKLRFGVQELKKEIGSMLQSRGFQLRGASRYDSESIVSKVEHDNQNILE